MQRWIRAPVEREVAPKMSDEEFEVILAELRQLRRAVTDSVAEIVHQQTEIRALHWLLEQKGIATAQELENAKVEGAREVSQILSQSAAEGSDTPMRVARDAKEHFRHRGHHRRRNIP